MTLPPQRPKSYRPPILALALAFGSGVTIASGQAPLGLWPLSLAALSLLLAQISTAPDWRIAAWLGAVAGAGHFATAMFWIIDPFLIDLPRHGWMAPFALVLMAQGLGLFWAAAAASALVLCPQGAVHPAWRVACLALCLTAFELLRGYLFTGLPWAALGHIWADTALIGWAAVFGASGLSALSVTLAALPVAFARFSALRSVGPATFLGICLGLWGLFGVLQAPTPMAAVSQGKPVQLRLVQPNTPQSDKWNPDLAMAHLDRAMALAGAASSTGRPPDLIVWPEASLPWLLNDSGPLLAEIARQAHGIPTLLGVTHRNGARYFNALVVIDGQGRQIALYDKHHLVPFGEYIPFGDQLSFLGLRGLAARDGAGYSPGPGPQILDLGTLGRILPLICYEAVFAQDLFRAKGRADWIVQITNDAWFGDLTGPYQHLAQARFRAAEQGLPLVRVANTGVSALIDPTGQILVEIPLNTTGYLDVTLPPPLPEPFYARHGDTPLILLLATLFSGFAAARIGRKRG